MNSSTPRPGAWQLRTRSLSLEAPPRIMGIVNVTPDSFSDGGHYFDTDRAVQHAQQLILDGADILDIGGESTRPYSEPVGVDEELRRIIPVIEALAAKVDVPISIDTSKAVVAREAIDAGAEIINDVTGLEGDPEMIQIARESQVGVCAMHMQGTPQTMQDAPVYEDVVEEILEYLVSRCDWLVDHGISRQRICLDPGIGFGKTHQHNLDLLANIERFHETECPLLVGHSRKGFIEKVTGDESPRKLAGTLTVSLHLARHGVQVIRVHDVLETLQALAMQRAMTVGANPMTWI